MMTGSGQAQSRRPLWRAQESTPARRLSRGRRLVMNGPPGAGKTSVGKALATRLGVAFFDLDEDIVSEIGTSIQAYFSRYGEAAFRAVERECLQRYIDKDGSYVLSVGGGALESVSWRRQLLQTHTICVLDVPFDICLQRCQQAPGSRPLANDTDFLRALFERRQRGYSECDFRVDGTKSIENIVDELAEKKDIDGVVVPLFDDSYRISFSSYSSALEEPNSFYFHDRNTAQYLPQGVRAFEVAIGERAKSDMQLVAAWRWLLDSGIRRNSKIVALGGGAVGDLSGFAASTILRGVRLEQRPTSLLAMVDSSVGGKTAINMPAGKNLVGTFFQPDSVTVDLQTLRTLSLEHRRSGIVEAIKAWWLGGSAVWEYSCDQSIDLDGLAEVDLAMLANLIKLALHLKIDVVAEDTLEKGARGSLNLGHTIAHGIEKASGYTMPHGHAVAYGLSAAFELSVFLGICDEEVAFAMNAQLRRFGLDIDYAGQMSDVVFHALQYDKKACADQKISFVMPTEPGKCDALDLDVKEIVRFLKKSAQ